MKFTTMVTFGFLCLMSPTLAQASDLRCADLFSKSGKLEAKADLARLALPAEVVSYLRANPAYGNRYPQFKNLEDAYFQGRVKDDWEIYRRLVPRRTSSILDIGSGIGGVDLMLYHGLKTDSKSPDITLVDKAKREQDGVEYNVIDSAREFLEKNGVEYDKIHALDSADPALFTKLSERSYDSIISLRGLAYMFPYSIYRNLILSNLSPGGTLILDIRVMKAPTLQQTEVIRKRFEADGFKSEDAILADLAETLGTPEIVATGTDYVRVRIVRTK